MKRPHKHIVTLERHGAYTASGASVRAAEHHTDFSLGRIVAQAYEGIQCGCGREGSCYGAEYWRYYFSRTTLVVMVAEFQPVHR